MHSGSCRIAFVRSVKIIGLDSKPGNDKPRLPCSDGTARSARFRTRSRIHAGQSMFRKPLWATDRPRLNIAGSPPRTPQRGVPTKGGSGACGGGMRRHRQGSQPTDDAVALMFRGAHPGLPEVSADLVSVNPYSGVNFGSIFSSSFDEADGRRECVGKKVEKKSCRPGLVLYITISLYERRPANTPRQWPPPSHPPPRWSPE